MYDVHEILQKQQMSKKSMPTPKLCFKLSPITTVIKILRKLLSVPV